MSTAATTLFTFTQVRSIFKVNIDINFIWGLTHFTLMFYFNTPWKYAYNTPENQRFSDVFRGYRNRILARIGLRFSKYINIAWDVLCDLVHTIAQIVLNRKISTKSSQDYLFARTLFIFTLHANPLLPSWLQMNVFIKNYIFKQDLFKIMCST